MQYDFDEIQDRRNTNSLKWDESKSKLPMWVADMDFKTAPEIMNAVIDRAKQGIYGYHIVPKEWYNAIQNWWLKRHRLLIEKEWLIFCTGVVPAITCAVKRMTNVGDNVLVQTPAYDIFFHSIENHGRHVLENELVYDEKKSSYHIDFEDLEKKLANPLTTLMILCNPHNPVGKIWSEEELEKIGALCEKYHVMVVSDEIHCDLTDTGKEYIPFAGVSKSCKINSITCISATKAFNLAGLQTAAVVIPNEVVYAKMKRGLNADEVAEPNCFAAEAVIAAFEKGESWLNQLREYITENKRTVKEYLKENIPELKFVTSDATYLVWIDCRSIVSDTSELVLDIRNKTGLYLLSGMQYRGNGKSFIRMNIACPRKEVLRGLEMLRTGLEKIQENSMR